MKIAAQNINNRGVCLSKSAINKSQRYMDRLYGSSCMRLYNKDCLSSPSYADMNEILTYLRQEFKEDSEYLISNDTGRLMLTEEMIQYALVVSSNSEFKDFILDVLYIVQAVEASKVYDILLRDAKFPKSKNEVTVSSRLGVSSCVKDSTKLPLDSPYALTAFNLSPSNHLEHCHYGSALVRGLMKYLGYSDEVYLSRSKADKACFLENLTAIQEERYIRLLLSGHILGSGEYGEKLNEVRANYYSDFYVDGNSSNQLTEFDEQIHIESMPYIVEIVKEYRNHLQEKDRFVSDFYVTDLSVVFEVRGCAETASVDSRNFEIGLFTFDTVNRNELGCSPRLLGYSGEFVSAIDVEKNGWYTISYPVKFSGAEYYPLYRVFYSEGGANIRPVITNFSNFRLTFESVDKYGGTSLNNIMENLEGSGISGAELFGMLAIIAGNCGEFDLVRYYTNAYISYITARNIELDDIALKIDALMRW